ncbi:MAG: hypothetical protein Q7S75_03635 [bacterium]|nr:hypothetical protein [bacterium]
MAYRQIGIHIVSLALLVFLTAPAIVSSAVIPGQIVTCDGVNCTICHLATVAQNVLNTGIFVAVFLSAILFAWAGFKYLTNVANPGGVNEAKSLFGSVLVGLLIILGAWLVIDTLMRTLVNPNALFGPWNKIC